MNSESLVALVGIGGAFILSCISVGVLFGKLFQRVDTLEKDLDAAHAEIRKLKNNGEKQ